MKKIEQSTDPIEKDFLDAIERVKMGKPTNASLKTKAKQGKLKLNASSVSLEAGHSRTLIGHSRCKYPELRKLIGESNAQKGDTHLDNERWRSEGIELRRKLAAALDQNAILMAKNLDLERQNEQMKRTQSKKP